MKKNSSQWSMSNPDGDAVCYGDAESACSQCTSPMLAAHSMRLPCQGGTPAICGVHIGFVGWEWEQGAHELNDPLLPGPALSHHLLCKGCTLWAWLFELFLLPHQGL